MEKLVKKRSYFKSCLVILGIILILFLTRSDIFFYGFHFLKRNNNVDIQSISEPRNYPFHEVSKEILERKADCSKIHLYTTNKARNTKIFCSNLYTTKVADIEKAKLEGSERIILYGEKIFFDVGTGQSDLNPQEIIDTAIFTDQITIPNMMSLYGIADLSYIKKNLNPYPALHIEIRYIDEINKGHNEKSGGYAYAYWGNLTSLGSLSGLKISKKSYYRQGTSDKITVSYSWPENCYVSQAMLHEINHNFTMIKDNPQKIEEYFNLPNWFDEQVASVAYIIFPEYVCGKGTIESYDSVIKGERGNENLIEFNTVMPPANLYNRKDDYCKNDCQKAIMVEWYRYLSKGDFKTQFQNYASQMRKVSETTNLREDNNLASFIASLNNTPESKNFLIKNGCKF